jgi:ATP adenylyltransferase/5',5'''-P-1,P-4-tetraphosphate phosphorylase II
MTLAEIQRANGSIDESKLVHKFDQLVDDGIVQYSSTQRAVRFQDQGLQVELIVSPALAAKPQLGETLDARFKRPEAKNAPPSASDIDVTGHDIGPFNGTHLLAFNKFCGYRPHLMLLTLDPTMKQTSDLDPTDIAAAWAALAALAPQEYIAMFNCGRDAGCSRMHKHVQMVPRPGDDFVLWPELVGWERPAVGFKFYEEALSPRMSANGVARICEELVHQARAGEGLHGEDEDGHFAHNVLLTRDWILVIPRRTNSYNGVSMNAVGFLGMSWGSDESYARRWMEVGPLNAMAGCGVPALK